MENLDLTKYCKGYNKESYVYNLYGVCNHVGSSDGGHYTAHIKNANGIWYNFNDTVIRKISNIEKTIVSDEAYCLFYEKKKLINASTVNFIYTIYLLTTKNKNLNFVNFR